MGSTDRRPLADTPVSAAIARGHDNRLGAVYSSLYAFWNARYHALGRRDARRDAYSVILFDSNPTVAIDNDFSHAPEALLTRLLQYVPRFGTKFDLAIQAAHRCMESNWSEDR